MKIYIIGITILFAIGTYMFIVDDNNQQKVKSTQPNKSISLINNRKKEVKLVENFNKDKIEIIKKEERPKKVLIEENQDTQLFDENSAPLDILEKIFSLRKGNKDDIPLQKQISSLESTLVYKLQNKSEEETYSMLKKFLALEETTEEDKKYMVDLLEVVGTDDSRALLVEMYINSESDEIKEKISKLNTPEVYTLLALDATQNDDTEKYQSMLNKLEQTNEKEVIGGFMAFTKNDNSDSLDNITQLATQWSSNNLSQRSAEITEDYLSKATAKPAERIVAISILANMKNREERDRILRKALEHEDNEDVINTIQAVLDNES